MTPSLPSAGAQHKAPDPAGGRTGGAGPAHGPAARLDRSAAGHTPRSAASVEASRDAGHLRAQKPGQDGNSCGPAAPSSRSSGLGHGADGGTQGSTWAPEVFGSSAGSPPRGGPSSRHRIHVQCGHQVTTRCSLLRVTEHSVLGLATCHPEDARN